MANEKQFHTVSVMLFDPQTERAIRLSRLQASGGLPSTADANEAAASAPSADLLAALGLPPNASSAVLWMRLWEVHPALLEIRRQRALDAIDKSKREQAMAGMTAEERRAFQHAENEQASKAELAEVEKLLGTARERWRSIEERVRPEDLAGLALPSAGKTSAITTLSTLAPELMADPKAGLRGLHGMDLALAAHKQEVATRRS